MRWNEEHAGKTRFAANEFMDMEVREVMRFRGGHVPRGKMGRFGRGKVGNHDEKKSGLMPSGSANEAEEPRFLLGDGKRGEDDEGFTPHVVPSDFDPSSLTSLFNSADRAVRSHSSRHSNPTGTLPTGKARICPSSS